MNEKKLFLSLACMSMPMILSAQLLGSLLNNNANSCLWGITKTISSTTKKQSLAGSKVYLYNVECGKFLGTEYSSSEYQFKARNNAKAMGFGAEGMKWTINSSFLQKGYFRITSNKGDLTIGQLFNHDADWKYTYIGQSTSDVFAFDKIAGTDYYTISPCPSDLLYGTSGWFGEGGKYTGGKKVYLGWSGEASFKIMLPLIPADDAEPRGTTWYLMSEADYKAYKNTIASAYQARMAAWPLIRSVRRSTMNIDIKNLENVYNNFKSTAAQINAAAAEAKEVILASLKYANKDSYIDLSFLMPDADCQEQSLASWTVESENGESFNYDEKTVRTTDKMLGGRFYEKKSADVLNPITISQVLDSLPVGRYTLSADFKVTSSDKQRAENVELFAGNNLADANSSCCSQGICEFTTTTFAIDQNSSKVKVGVRVGETNANYVAFDNFKLRYLGGIEPVVPETASATTPVAPAYENGYSVENGTLKVTGTWKEEDKPLLDYVVKANSNVNVVDLQDVDEVSENTIVDVTDFDNKNVLVYVKDGSDLTVVDNGEEKTTNVVKDDYCENLVVEDYSEINIAKPFVANTVTYERVVRNDKYGTICLPIPLKSVAGKIQLYTVSGYVNGKVKMKTIASVPANTPCVFKKLTNDSTISVIDENIEVPSTNVILNSEKTSDGAFMTGSYVNNVLVGSLDGTQKADQCYYFENDKMVKGNNYFYLDAFRAYIDTRECNTTSNVRTRSAMSDSFMEDLATAIDEADAENPEMAECYNVSGTKTSSLKSGLNIVKYSDGTVKKIIRK